MPSKNKKTISAKISIEEYEVIKRKAQERGLSVDAYVRESLRANNISGKMAYLVFTYDLTYESLIDGIEYLLKTGQIVVKDGRMETSKNEIEEWTKMVGNAE